LELADDEIPVLYKMGEAFFYLKLNAAKKQLRADMKRYDQEIGGLQARSEECEKGMKELKVLLYVTTSQSDAQLTTRYAKFGKQINLETTLE